MRYEKFKKKCDDKSSVWYYFLRAEDGQSGKCNLCQKIIKSHGGTTTGLRVHLHSAHTIDISKLDAKNETNEDSSHRTVPQCTGETLTLDKLHKPHSTFSDSSGMNKKRKVTDYFQSSYSMEATICRITALDGIAFSVLCTSEDIRRLFKNSGYEKLPKSPKGIKNIVMNYTKQEKKKLVGELKQLLHSDKKFSLTFDEWTSNRNARYINLNIHCGDEFADGSRFKNLGLVRINGTMPADTCVQLIKEKLTEFDLSLDRDIVAITTDGASVMLKVGRSLETYHQVCLAHGIQLAVTDVLYKKSITDEIRNTVQIQNTASAASDSDSDSEKDDENSDEDDNNGSLEIGSTQSNLYRLNDDYKSLINKVRKVVKIFKNSPVKNDMYLQKHVKQDMGKELQLLADCKTRWGSMAIMLERFNRLKSCVSKALIDMNSNIKFTQHEFAMLDSMQNSLNIIKVTVEALCRRDATLLTADAALKFMLRKLDSQISILSKKLAASLRERITQRRLPVATLLQYLHNPENYFKDAASASDSDNFTKLTNLEIAEAIYSLIQRFEIQSSVQMYDLAKASTSTSISVSDDEDCGNFEKELNKEIEKSLREKISQPNPRNEEENEAGGGDDAHDATDKFKVIRIEMALYENGGNRGFHLDKAYKYLMTIPPTSVESERAFSSAAYTCNKIRSSLKDNTLDALCFLRSLFQQARSHSNQLQLPSTTKS